MIVLCIYTSGRYTHIMSFVREELDEGDIFHLSLCFSEALLPIGPTILLNSKWLGTPTISFLKLSLEIITWSCHHAEIYGTVLENDATF